MIGFIKIRDDYYKVDDICYILVEEQDNIYKVYVSLGNQNNKIYVCKDEDDLNKTLDNAYSLNTNLNFIHLKDDLIINLNKCSAIHIKQSIDVIHYVYISWYDFDKQSCFILTEKEKENLEKLLKNTYCSEEVIRGY